MNEHNNFLSSKLPFLEKSKQIPYNIRFTQIYSIAEESKKNTKGVFRVLGPSIGITIKKYHSENYINKTSFYKPITKLIEKTNGKIKDKS